MPISNQFRYVALTFECPRCGHQVVRTGLWFKSVGNFKCEACKAKIRLGYEDKLALIEKSKPVNSPFRAP